MKKLLLIVSFLVSFFATKAQTVSDLLYSAKTSFIASDYKKANSLYSQADSIDSLTYYYKIGSTNDANGSIALKSGDKISLNKNNNFITVWAWDG